MKIPTLLNANAPSPGLPTMNVSAVVPSLLNIVYD